ncbi:MAG: hypothetical protein U1G07_22690 [Verrucomicrobiota bacterium]
MARELIRLILSVSPEPGEATQLGHFPTLYARMETELLPTQRNCHWRDSTNLMLPIVQRLMPRSTSSGQCEGHRDRSAR